MALKIINKKNPIKNIKQIINNFDFSTKNNFTISTKKQNESLYIYYKNIFQNKLSPLIKANFKIKENKILKLNKNKFDSIINKVENQIYSETLNSGTIEEIDIDFNRDLDSENIFYSNRKKIFLIQQKNLINMVKKEIINSIFDSKEVIVNQKTIKIEENMVKEQIEFSFKVITKLQNDLKTFTNKTSNHNLVYNYINKIIDNSINELSIFLNKEDKNINELVGLGEYFKQLSKYIKYIQNQNTEISTNFFVDNHIFSNAYVFIFGRHNEELLKREIINNNKKQKTNSLSKEKWEVFSHYLSVINVFCEQRSGLINNQINLYKNTSTIDNKEIILKQLHFVKEQFDKTKISLIEYLKQIYKNSGNSIELKTLLKDKLDFNLSFKDQNNKTIIFEDILYNDNYKQKNIKNLEMNISKYSSYLKYLNHKTNEITYNNLKKHEQKHINHYRKYKNIPIMDLEVDNFKKMIEIKNLKINNLEIILPFHFNSRNREEIEDNIHSKKYLKDNQSELFLINTIRFNNMSNALNISKDNLYYYFNIFDKLTHTVKKIQIPLLEYEKIFMNEDLIDNSKLIKRGSYKIGLKIKSDFFNNFFKDFEVIEKTKTKINYVNANI